MNLRSKKRMAAKVLKVGLSRVRFDPERLERVEDAITRDSIRGLVKEGIIRVEQAKGVSRARSAPKGGRARGVGSREGPKGARQGKKRLWVTKVRALRRYLKMLRDRGEITKKDFNRLRVQVRGGQAGSLRHLKEIVDKMVRR